MDVVTRQAGLSGWGRRHLQRRNAILSMDAVDNQNQDERAGSAKCSVNSLVKEETWVEPFLGPRSSGGGIPSQDLDIREPISEEGVRSNQPRDT